MKRDTLNTRSEQPHGPLSDLERSEFYLREGERLAHMGSWSLRADGIFDYWSPETFMIFNFDPCAIAAATASIFMACSLR